MNLNINDYGGKSVVPISCGDDRGTAFYVGRNFFLTAFHVVSDAEFDPPYVIVVLDDKEMPCKVIRFGKDDIALLKCMVNLDQTTIKPIPILDSEFMGGLDLMIIGFPQEIGNGIDYFGVSVRNERELCDNSRGFDVVVLRTDPMGFSSYSGFSGSPVLNEFGYAVGVVTDQFHNSLGYSSIRSISDQLSKYVDIEKNADRFDTRPYGIGTCIKAAEKAVSKAKSRYQENLHIVNESFESDLQLFCGLGIEEMREKLHGEFMEWHDDPPDTMRSFCGDFPHLSKYIECGEIEDGFNEDMKRLREDGFKSNSEKYGSEFFKLSKDLFELLDAKELSEKKFLFISGDAGCGKTHNLCHFVQSICRNINVYLFFGTEFNGQNDPIRAIGEILSWDDPVFLRALDSEMKDRGRYAIFIIDSLNEGEGTLFWADKIEYLKSEIGRYERLKLIVSVRTMEADDKLRVVLSKKNNWEEIEIRGFTNLKKAVEKYFMAYNINEETSIYSTNHEFFHPLFLKIFCESYSSLPIDKRKDMDILYLYEMYFRKRNIEVSRQTDEDPNRNITSLFMNTVGKLSLQMYNCYDILREDAVGIANRLCPSRLWSKNLYHSMLNVNLLMEYISIEGKERTAFQYDSMGDYVRAANIMHEYYTDQARYDFIRHLCSIYDSGQIPWRERSRIFNTVKTFLSVWNPDSPFWDMLEKSSGTIRIALGESLSLRNMNAACSTLGIDAVERLLSQDGNFLNIEFILKRLDLYVGALMFRLHERLMKMSLHERDEQWTIGVNRILERHLQNWAFDRLDNVNEKDCLRLMCWMLTSSHPDMHYRVMRHMKDILLKNSGMCSVLMGQFKGVNDPYVLEGLYGAIYGVLLRKHDPQLSSEIAAIVFKQYYENPTDAPSYLPVRVWTLKIIEYNHYLNPDEEFWNRSQPPYIVSDSSPMRYPATENFADDEYFGAGIGARMLYESLFNRDFNRYVIGTNSGNVSGIFQYRNEKEPVCLEDIANAIAYRIKEVYQYSPQLSEYDKHISSGFSLENKRERIGKKYQWLALGEVYAYLCDICNMKENWLSDKIAECPYPWYVDYLPKIDPTLSVSENKIKIDNSMFSKMDDEELFELEDEEWINSRKEEFMPKVNLILRSQVEDDEWVVIVGYQKYRKRRQDSTRETFVFYSPCLVKKEYERDFAEWAKKQCFYGRKMPEAREGFDFVWNEYPWSERARNSELGEIEIVLCDAPCKVLLPYSTQQQENFIAVDDSDDVTGQVFMPSADMYKMFGLRNAERGIVLDSKDEVVAVHRNIPKDSFSGLVIKRDVLNKYLEEKGYTLFFCNLAEKTISSGINNFEIQRLSCCYEYCQEGEPIILQLMKDERDFEGYRNFIKKHKL